MRQLGKQVSRWGRRAGGKGCPTLPRVLRGNFSAPEATHPLEALAIVLSEHCHWFDFPLHEEVSTCTLGAERNTVAAEDVILRRT